MYLFEDSVTDRFLNMEIRKSYLETDFHIHQHDYTEILIVLDGAARHVVGNGSYLLRPGDVCVIKPGVSHGFCDVRHFRHCNIMFNSDIAFENYRSLHKLLGFQILFSAGIEQKEDVYKSMVRLDPEDLVSVDKLTDRMLKEMNGKEPGYEAVCRSLLIELVVFCSRKYNPDLGFHGKNTINLARTVIFMEEHFREELSLEQLAGLSCLSPRHFSRTFQQVYKMSPFSYVYSLRIEYACNLLRRTESSVTEIALLSGFAGGNYFARVFKKCKGVSPTEYRRLSAAI